MRPSDPPMIPDALERQWKAIEAGLETHARRRKQAQVGGAGAAIVASALLLFSLTGKPAVDLAPRTDFIAIEQSTELRIPDGSSMTIRPGAQGRLLEATPNSVSLSLAEGEASFSVRPDPKRQFSVELGGTRVVVIGTRFTLRREIDRVSVSVKEGRVRVERSEEPPIILGAGETWTGPVHGPKTSPKAEHPNLREEAAGEAGRDGQTAGSSSRLEAPGPGVGTKVPTGEEQSMDSGVGSATRGLGRGRGTRSRGLTSTGPRELFQAALAARRQGRFRAAERSLVRLLKVAPQDDRASLAAFELGRLRMDRLDDPRGAARALERAARSEGPFAEDALARLIQAYNQLGEELRCRAAVRRYRSQYPSGMHLGQLRGACDG